VSDRMRIAMCLAECSRPKSSGEPIKGRVAPDGHAGCTSFFRLPEFGQWAGLSPSAYAAPATGACHASSSFLRRLIGSAR
jgi:hypothetical protein